MQMQTPESIASTAPAKWADYLAQARAAVGEESSLEVRGTLTKLTGLVLEASGIRVPVGSQCVVTMKAREPVLAEVVGFSGDRAYLMPAGDVHGLSSGAGVAALVVQANLGAVNGRYSTKVFVGQGERHLVALHGLPITAHGQRVT
jgi:flagellum-specific ATP synthase